MRERGAWKALRHRTCTISIATGVLPSRQNYCNSFFRALRTRLLSLRSVVPSRHLTHNLTPCTNVHFIEQKCAIHWTKMFNVFFCHQWITAVQYDCVVRGDARKPFLRARVYAKNTPKNYTYPALIDLIAWYLVRLIVYSLYSQPSTSDGLTRCECPCFQQDDFTFRKGVFTFSKIVFTICAEKVCYKLCNGRYKLSNTCYKLCNAYYKLCNKNYLIG